MFQDPFFPTFSLSLSVSAPRFPPYSLITERDGTLMAWWTPIEACSPDRGVWEDRQVNLARAALSGDISSGPQNKPFPSWQHFDARSPCLVGALSGR